MLLYPTILYLPLEVRVVLDIFEKIKRFQKLIFPPILFQNKQEKMLLELNNRTLICFEHFFFIFFSLFLFFSILPLTVDLLFN